MTLEAHLSERAREVSEILATVSAWAQGRADIEAVALVGSWARRAARPDSDVDLIFLTIDPFLYIERDDWADAFGIKRFVGTVQWGRLTERRAITASGLEIEFGITSAEWASVNPVDEGTLRVVTDGMTVVYDRAGRMTALSQVIGR